MRYFSSMAAGAVIAATFATGASAGGCGCGSQWGVNVVYGVQPSYAYAPVGYVLDPSDARRPMYLVNQGPTYVGPGIGWVRPTFSEGAYAYAQPYPYIGGRGYLSRPYAYGGAYRWHQRRHFRPAMMRGPHAYHHGWRSSAYRPYGAYNMRVAPDARVIRVAPYRRPFAAHRYGFRPAPRYAAPQYMSPRYGARARWR